MSARGSQYQFVNLISMIEGEQLRHPTAHRMAHNDCVFNLKMTHQSHDVLGEHRRGVIDGGFARLTGAAIVVNDHAMVAGKLLDLIDLPNLAVACGFTQKYHRAALAVLFVVNFHVVHFDGWHRSSS